MVENGLSSFCIKKKKKKIITQNLVNGLHLLKDQVFIIQHPNYVTFQSKLLLIWGSSNFYCPVNRQ